MKREGGLLNHRPSKTWFVATSFPGSLILPPPEASSLQGAVRWETLGTRLGLWGSGCDGVQTVNSRAVRSCNHEREIGRASVVLMAWKKCE